MQRAVARTPSANQEQITRLAGDVLDRMPDHYRKASAWLRSRLLRKVSAALSAAAA
ncbi:hypothetical protein AB0K60_12340 [Thermopolyspora sp. NPDC052614]|uniref:hypothetical protein n=1 Tax=Thermopolyspora sp. NPDC052614 TaxID=3155682 RepID=UPI003426C212